MSSCRLYFNEQPLDVPGSGHQQQTTWQRQNRTVCVAHVQGMSAGARGTAGRNGPDSVCPALSELLPHGLISSSHPVSHTDEAAVGVAPTGHTQRGSVRTRVTHADMRREAGAWPTVEGRQCQEESRDQGAWSRQAALLAPTYLPGWDFWVRTRRLPGMRGARGPPGPPSFPQEGPRRLGTGGAQSRQAGSRDRVQDGLPAHAVFRPQPGGRQSLEGSLGAHDGSGMRGPQPIEGQGCPPQGPGCDPMVPHSHPSGQASPRAPAGQGVTPKYPHCRLEEEAGGSQWTWVSSHRAGWPHLLHVLPAPPEEPAEGRRLATRNPERGPRFRSQSHQRPLRGRAIFSRAKNSLC